MILRATKDSPNAYRAKIAGFLLPQNEPRLLIVFTNKGVNKITADGMTGEEVLYSMLKEEPIRVKMETIE